MLLRDEEVDFYAELFRRSKHQPEISFEEFLRRFVAREPTVVPVRINGQLVQPNWPELQRLRAERMKV